MVEFGLEHGVSAARLLSGTRLSAAHLDNPNLELSAGQELRIALNLMRESKSPAGLAIDLGRRYHISTYGIWGYGLICSSTARESMAFSLRYLPLTYAFTDIRCREDGVLAQLSFDAPRLASGITRFLVQRDMAASATLMREVQGGAFRLARFAFKGPRPAQWAQLSSIILDHFGVQAEFGASANILAFDRSLMDRPLPQAHPLTVAMCEQACKRLMAQRRARAGAAAMIRQVLDAAPAEASCQLAQIARLLNVSDRTLKRRLHGEGTTFRALLADHRAALAEELLTDGGLSCTETAERLGFSDLSTFSQAFKRWFGVSPRNFLMAEAVRAPASRAFTRVSPPAPRAARSARSPSAGRSRCR